METKITPISYRHLRLKDLNRPEYSHLKLLLYWPVFGLLFFYAERLQPMRDYHVVHCALDDLIPFNELFLIPYLFWFVFLLGMHLYTLRYDVETFRKMMHFIILTYSAALAICAVAYDWCYRREEAQGSEAAEPLWSPRKRRARTQAVK